MKLEKQAPFPWQKGLWSNLCGLYMSQKLAHAYLISGPQGTGKELFVTEFANFVMCNTQNNELACNNCRNCLLGRKSGHPDIVYLKIEEGSSNIKIQQIRELSEFFLQTSYSGRAKIAIINNAHCMNTAAANALLKTLEEPTKNTYLFLVSHLPGSIVATIRSRCQKLIMSTPSNRETVDWLKQYIPDQENPQTLAITARNCPLLALELARSGGLHNKHQFLQKLTELTAGKASIQAVARLAVKLGEVETIGYLLEVSSLLIKHILLNQQPSDIESHQGALLELFHVKRTCSQKTVLSLMRFYDQVLESQQQLMGVANPNSQLIVESMLWRWSQLMTFQQ